MLKITTKLGYFLNFIMLQPPFAIWFVKLVQYQPINKDI